MIKAYICYKDITIPHLYASNIRISKCKAKLIETKDQMDKSTIIARDFNISLLVNGRESNRKISKNIGGLNS